MTDALGLEPPVNFVHRESAIWAHLIGQCVPPAAEECRLPFDSGSASWIVQTWIHLRRRGYDVGLSSRLRRDAVNVIHYDHLGWKRMPVPCFVVAVQADRGRPEVCDLRVVQNYLSVRDSGRGPLDPPLAAGRAPAAAGHAR